MRFFKNVVLLFLVFVLFSCSKEEEIITPPAPNKYTITITAEAGGSVSSQGGTYNEGSKITITATPDGQYLFEKWSDGSTVNPREITVTSNLTLSATFVKKTYQLSVTVEGEGTVQEEVIIQGSTSETTYNAGTTVRLTATPNEGWVFAGWSGDVESEELEIEVPIEKGTAVSALFKRDSFELNITIEGEGTVKEEVIVQPSQYDFETVVRLTAVPAEGWMFDNWSGDIESTDNPFEATMLGQINLTATFKRAFTVNTKVINYGLTFTDNETQEQFKTIGGVDSLALDANKLYTVSPNIDISGYDFYKWIVTDSGSSEVFYTNTIEVLMNETKRIELVLKKELVSVTNFTGVKSITISSPDSLFYTETDYVDKQGLNTIHRTLYVESGKQNLKLKFSPENGFETVYAFVRNNDNWWAKKDEIIIGSWPGFGSGLNSYDFRNHTIELRALIGSPIAVSGDTPSPIQYYDPKTDKSYSKNRLIINEVLNSEFVTQPLVAQLNETDNLIGVLGTDFYFSNRYGEIYKRNLEGSTSQVMNSGETRSLSGLTPILINGSPYIASIETQNDLRIILRASGFGGIQTTFNQNEIRNLRSIGSIEFKDEVRFYVKFQADYDPVFLNYNTVEFWVYKVRSDGKFEKKRIITIPQNLDTAYQSSKIFRTNSGYGIIINNRLIYLFDNQDNQLNTFQLSTPNNFPEIKQDKDGWYIFYSLDGPSRYNYPDPFFGNWREPFNKFYIYSADFNLIGERSNQYISHSSGGTTVAEQKRYDPYVGPHLINSVLEKNGKIYPFSINGYRVDVTIEGY